MVNAPSRLALPVLITWVEEAAFTCAALRASILGHKINVKEEKVIFGIRLLVLYR